MLVHPLGELPLEVRGHLLLLAFGQNDRCARVRSYILHVCQEYFFLFLSRICVPPTIALRSFPRPVFIVAARLRLTGPFTSSSSPSGHAYGAGSPFPFLALLSHSYG